MLYNLHPDIGLYDLNFSMLYTDKDNTFFYEKTVHRYV